MKLVSIIIPAYNAEKQIEQCLASAAGQTYENIEIVVIDDGSEDKTGEICERYSGTDPRVRVFHTENRGVSAARNLGMREAGGNYFLFVDADDLLEEDAVHSLMQYSDGREWVIGNYRLYDRKAGKKEQHRMYFEEPVREADREEIAALCLNRNFYCVWAKLYNAEIVRKNGLKFCETKSYGEDLLFNMEYFCYVNSLAILQKEVYAYCYEFGDGLGTRFRDKEWDFQKEVCLRMRELAEGAYGLKEETKHRLNHFYYAQAVLTIERIVKEKTISGGCRRKKSKEVTSDPLFREVLVREFRAKRIRALDYWMLTAHQGYLYTKVHELYVKLKGRS